MRILSKYPHKDKKKRLPEHGLIALNAFTVPVGSIKNLRASGFFPSDSYWENYLAQMKLAGGTVGFDVQGHVKKFGIQLTEPEAQEVGRELEPHMPY